MNSDASMDLDSAGISEREHPAAWSPLVRASRLDLDHISSGLLRTIAEVLDIRHVFPRVSEIVREALPHDALELVFHDRCGHVTLHARSVEELASAVGCAVRDEEPFYIVSDLRTPGSPANDAQATVVDALLVAGYRSILNVRSVARDQVMRLSFLSKQADAYRPEDVLTAQHISGYVALAVAHEQLAAAERDRAEARGRAERLDGPVRTFTDMAEAVPAYGRMTGRSPVWQRAVARALRVAPTEATVFLHGESGTGKEVMARFVHQASPRKNGPFIAINCAALPEHLLESELFGYERGAFTGAQQAKAGQIELASRGVLFLDEVSEMSPMAQAKVLRFLQEREFLRLGGTRIQKANVRVIAASNRDLREAVGRGAFREDLFYRLQVFDIQLPALRERLSDVPLLAEQFLAEFGKALGHGSLRLSDDARDALLDHAWPGNVRELRNVLESAAILSETGMIERNHLPLQATTIAAAPTDLSGIERQTIETVLRQTDWNKSKTARRLGLTRTQLYVRLRRYRLDAPVATR